MFSHLFVCTSKLKLFTLLEAIDLHSVISPKCSTRKLYFAQICHLLCRQKEASSFLVHTFTWLFWFLNFFLLNLTTTLELYLLCNDVIICDIGLLLLIMINAMSRRKTVYSTYKFLKEFPNKKWFRGFLNHVLEKNLQLWLWWTPCQ